MIDLRFARTAGVRDPGLLAACDAVMQPEERSQHRSLVFDRHRHEYLVTRALARAVLGARLGVSPHTLRFRRNTFGRPEIDPPSRLQFNLTNTVEMVAIAVVEDCAVGVDAEPVSRADAILELAPSVFTAYERALLGSDLLPARRLRAVRQWTMKEAYMKARGMGLSIPVEQFEIDLSHDVAALRLLAPLDPRPARWTFKTFDVDDHVISVCVENDGHRDIPVEVQHADLGAILESANSLQGRRVS